MRIKTGENMDKFDLDTKQELIYSDSLNINDILYVFNICPPNNKDLIDIALMKYLTNTTEDTIASLTNRGQANISYTVNCALPRHIERIIDWIHTIPYYLQYINTDKFKKSKICNKKAYAITLTLYCGSYSQAQRYCKNKGVQISTACIREYIIEIPIQEHPELCNYINKWICRIGNGIYNKRRYENEKRRRKEN